MGVRVSRRLGLRRRAPDSRTRRSRHSQYRFPSRRNNHHTRGSDAAVPKGYQLPNSVGSRRSQAQFGRLRQAVAQLASQLQLGSHSGGGRTRGKA